MDKLAIKPLYADRFNDGLTPSARAEKDLLKRRLRLRANGKIGKNYADLYQPDLEAANGVYLSTHHLQYMFSVTGQTIYNWRNKYNLPYFTVPGVQRPPIRFDEGLILHWAQHFNRDVVKDDYKELFAK